MSDRFKLIFGLAIMLGTAFFGLWQWNIMQTHAIAVKTLNAQASILNSEQRALIEDYQDVKVAVTKSREGAIQSLSLVFPSSEDLTHLTRVFDDFAAKNNFENNPFFISNITYKNAQTSKLNHRYVPVTMSLSTSKKNLNKFLEFVEQSGSLEAGTRLMSIEDMTISYPSGEDEVYSVRLTLNAYFAREL